MNASLPTMSTSGNPRDPWLLMLIATFAAIAAIVFWRFIA